MELRCLLTMNAKYTSQIELIRSGNTKADRKNAVPKYLMFSVKADDIGQLVESIQLSKLENLPRQVIQNHLC